MSNINISIPENLKAYVEAQAVRYCFSSSGDYVNHIIQMDKERKELEHRNKISQYLAFCELQVSKGDVVSYSRERIIAKAKNEL